MPKNNRRKPMSMIAVMSAIRDDIKKQMDEGKPLQWICPIRQNDCIEPGKSCRDCDVFIDFKGGKYGIEKQ